MLAALRPTDWNWILLFHLLTAFLLVGGMLIVTITSLGTGRARTEQVPMLRTIAFRTTLILVIPMYVLIHVFGPWLAGKEYPHHTPNWLDTSFALATLGIVFALALAALQYWGIRRLRAGKTASWPEWIVNWLPVLLLLSLVATIWLMSAKPS